MKETTVTLGGKQYTIRERPMRSNALWRREVEETLSPITRIAAEATTIDRGTELSAVVDLVREAGRVLLSSPETIVDLVHKYADEIAADADRLADEAYDSEYLDAFAEVVRLAYPFALIGRVLSRLPISPNGQT